MPTAYLQLPIDFLRFWYKDGPWELLHFFVALNRAFFQLFSLPLFIKTFFKPIKNEYRQGLVGFSIGMGIVIKSVFILVDLILFSVLIALEIAIFAFFVLLPLLPLLILFY